jgi:hypothetical protein
VYLLALTAIKTLGRNPVGSQTLFTQPHLLTLLHHSALPLPPSPSPFSHASHQPLSLPALEATKILANILVLHSTSRRRLAKLGAGKAIARELAGKNGLGDWVGEDDGDIGGVKLVERLFLLGRVGFLVTMERGDTVGCMVDKEDLVESLVYVSHLLYRDGGREDG